MHAEKLDEHSKWLENVQELINEAFPPDERIDIEEMLPFSIETDVLGFFNDESFIGFALIVQNLKSVYVALFAIAAAYRGCGHGSEALNIIKSTYPDRQVILDFEEVVENALNYGQRVSRKKFYLRNGFYETGRYTVLCNEKYEVVCSGQELDEQGLMEIISGFHKRNPRFEDVLL